MVQAAANPTSENIARTSGASQSEEPVTDNKMPGAAVPVGGKGGNLGALLRRAQNIPSLAVDQPSGQQQDRNRAEQRPKENKPAGQTGPGQTGD